jgi:hypothetical protein
MHGAHTVHTAPIWCTWLPHGDTTTRWAPYCARCSHIAPSSSHMVPHGSHKPSTSCPVQLAPIWPPYFSLGSHMAHISHLAPYGPQGFHMAPMWCRPLPYSAHGSHTTHIARRSASQLAPSWLPYGAKRLPYGSHRLAHSSHMANNRLPYGPNMAPIWCIQLPYVTICLQHGANGSHKPSTSHTVHTVSIWPADGAWHHPPPNRPTQLPHGSYMVPVAPICCIWLPYGTINLLFGTIWLPHGHMAPIRLL